MDVNLEYAFIIDKKNNNLFYELDHTRLYIKIPDSFFLLGVKYFYYRSTSFNEISYNIPSTVRRVI
jgi:hypothetical protein